MTRALIISLAALAITGCAVFHPKRPEPIPRRGTVVAQGEGQQLSFRAPGPGLVSVFDVDANAIVHSSALNEGGVITVNPQSGSVTVTDIGRAGAQTVHTGIKKSHRYELWYIPQNPASTRWAY